MVCGYTNDRPNRVGDIIIVEAPTPDQDPINNLKGTKISICLRLNFDMVGTGVRSGRIQ